VHSWTQTPIPGGFTPTSNGTTGSNIDCTDRDGGPFEHRSTVSGTTANFNVQAGETVRCTWFYNEAPA
jgi:hypothetical protein